MVYYGILSPHITRQRMSFRAKLCLRNALPLHRAAHYFNIHQYINYVICALKTVYTTQKPCRINPQVTLNLSQ